MSKSTLERRDFLRRLAGGGLALAFGTHGGTLVARTLQDAESDDGWSPNVWLTLHPDGACTIVAHRSEMGTGIKTSLPMVVADELEADWQRVTIEQAPGDAKYGSQNTDGSRSIRNFYDTMRTAGATARWMLEHAAAASWEVPAGECRAEQHEVVHGPSGRRIGFGELAARAAEVAVPEAGQLRYKKPEERKLVGVGAPIDDLEGILDGSAVYGADVRLPGMKYAAIARSPVLGGQPREVDGGKAWNEAAALAVPGVEAVIALPCIGPDQAPTFRPLGGVAVIATNTWAALQGREKLAVQWDDGPRGNANTPAQMEALRSEVAQPARVVRERGDVGAALEAAGAGRRIAASYEAPYLAHAPMEPPCAVAHVTEDGCHCWAPTQNPQAAQQTVSQLLGLTDEQVRVDVTLLGGGFGRKSKPDYVAEAALLSREIGAPVQVFWTREDDIRHDYFHAVSALHMEGALDEAGKCTAWLGRSAFTPIGSTFNASVRQGSGGELGLGFTDVPWATPNLRVENGEAETPVRVGWLRSVCNVFHAFAAHSFADELAHAAGRDPLEFLLELIGEPRHVDPTAEGAEYGNYGASLDDQPIDTGRLAHVLRRAAEMAGWGTRELAPNRALGIAVHRSFLAYVANVVEVEVTPDGKLSVPRVDVCCDAGLVIHPERVRGQIEGGALYGMSLALHGEITVDRGRVQQSNFHDYPVVRMNEAPREWNIEIVESEALPCGVGEVATPPFAPALCNAIFAASGHRIRRLPIGQQDLSQG